MYYSLTIIRLNKKTLQFENTECNSPCNKDTLISLMSSYCHDGDNNEIIEEINNIKLGHSKTIHLENSASNKAWFVYINTFKSHLS